MSRQTFGSGHAAHDRGWRDHRGARIVGRGRYVAPSRRCCDAVAIITGRDEDDAGHRDEAGHVLLDLHYPSRGNRSATGRALRASPDARGSLLALRPRLSPSLPLSRPLAGRGRSCLVDRAARSVVRHGADLERLAIHRGFLASNSTNVACGGSLSSSGCGAHGCRQREPWIECRRRARLVPKPEVQHENAPQRSRVVPASAQVLAA